MSDTGVSQRPSREAEPVKRPVAYYCHHQQLTVRPNFQCSTDEPIYDGDCVVTSTEYRVVDGMLMVGDEVEVRHHRG